MARLLLDENLPVRLRPLLRGHTVSTVRDRRWLGVRNGILLRRAELEFDVFVTMDTSIPFQQAVSGLEIGVLLIRARNNSLLELRNHVDRISEAAHEVPFGQIVELDLRSTA